jgi:hypothetical protein
MHKICHAFAARKISFLSQDEWKSIPWTFQDKSTFDQLLDILVDIPNTAEELAQGDGSAPLTELRRLDLLLDIESLAFGLAAWRDRWQLSRAEVAREVDGGLDLSEIYDPPSREILSKTILFPSATDALEILCYNGGLVRLMEMHELLASGIDRKSLATQLNESYLSDGRSEQPPNPPLWLPHQIRSLSQPALEGLRVVPFFNRQLAIDSAFAMVPLAPLGILYCAWRRMPAIASSLPLLLRDVLLFRESAEELQGFDLLVPARAHLEGRA